MAKGFYAGRRSVRLYDENFCPCCGKPVEVPGLIYLWEEELQAIRGEVVVNLYRAEFNALRKLLDEWPRKVMHDDLIEVMWPDGAPESVYSRKCNLLNVKFSRLRRLIAPLGLSIPLGINGDYAYALRIAKWPEGRERLPLRTVK